MKVDTHTVETISERIWLAIAERRLRPGMRLKEAELTEIFNVSRARIRATLAALERDGLVVLHPNRGAVVAKPSAEEARDVFAIRRAVEHRVLERLVGTVTPAQVTRMLAHVEEERVANNDNDTRRIILLSGGFHMMLAEMCGAEFLCGLMRDLVGRTSLITAVFRVGDKHNCGPDEHAEIVRFISDGDVARASACMIHHLEHVEAELDLEQNQDAPENLKAALA